MLLSVMAVFFAFSFGGLGGFFLASRSIPVWANLTGGVVSLAVYFCLVLGLPFFGILIEGIVVLAAAGAASWPLQIIHVFNREFPPGSSKGRPPMIGVVAMVVLLVCMAGILGTLLSRINYALWLRWECDGTIIKRTSNRGNHNAPVLVVRTGHGDDWFENVDAQLWNTWIAGSRLVKISGSPMALLDGRPVRMVPLQINWWNDPL